MFVKTTDGVSSLETCAVLFSTIKASQHGGSFLVILRFFFFLPYSQSVSFNLLFICLLFIVGGSVYGESRVPKSLIIMPGACLIYNSTSSRICFMKLDILVLGVYV